MPQESKPSDIQAPARTQVSLHRNEAGNRVMAQVAIGKQPLTIDQNWLTAELESAELKGAVIAKSGILQLQRMLASGENGTVEIGECHDAEVGLRLSEDNLVAKLTLKTARGGSPLSTEHLNDVIEHAKIAPHLIDQKTINRLLAAAHTARPGATLQIVIARGKAAIDGNDSPFEPLVKISQRRPAERADGSLDYRDLGAIPTVKPGDVLMRRHPPTKGVDGFNLQGEVIKAKDGRQLPFNHHKGTAVSEQDPNLLVATVTGQPVLQQAGASVDPVLKINEVDMRSGHIDYDGTLMVKGSVSPGMRIKVTGDVQIMGMVECAEIYVSGNLDVKMGITGPSDDARQEGLSMRVHCGGNLSAGHVEKAELDVKGDIAIKSQITHSQVRCDHHVVVGSTGQPRSGIVGGRVQASKLIRAQTLGAEAGITTEAMIQASTDIMRQLEDHNENVACKQADLGRLLRVMVDLSKTQAPDIEPRLKKINSTCNTLKAELSTLTVERDQLQATVDAIAGSCIEVQDAIYPRVFITIGDKTQEIMDRANQVRFCYAEGRLRQSPLKAK
ncbi:DUF342 domain-containing protein [Thiorhodovibrio frisius]|uniref:Putative polymerase with PALM domain, HD hydrolase domain and Zn ribbon n=1 Tax=Thiorhodovibrio frisius TaxID=631362 RepID=H8YWS3_9GAMM|nr:FapA family protein [Thiorhodovibrio frisius]EIC22899.1 putative polymerase with PALM domain, HD hydrolase domain and Zn ribbon [Thiorhodovibrio frisius]WPL22841.1 hypothetical protein Thiofri_03016 [Thiorhodovibrio frisius]